MYKLLAFIGVLCPFFLCAQNAELVFQTGFEPNTDTTQQTVGSARLTGNDLSFATHSDWDAFDARTDMGSSLFQYEGGTPAQRLMELVPDPLDANNTALKFWIREPNVGGEKGRVQSNLYNNDSTVTNILYNVRLLLPTDLDTLKTLPTRLHWFTLMEVWNNPAWMDPQHGFRITLNLYKPNDEPDSLYFHVHGQTYDTTTGNYVDYWSAWDSTFHVPTGQWVNLEVQVIEGDDNSGRFFFAATPEGGQRHILYDLTVATHHPADPSPNGITSFNPMKPYMAGSLVDSMRSWNRLVQAHWDDFVLWKDSVIGTGMPIGQETLPTRIFPNPAQSHVTIEVPAQNSVDLLQLYTTDGKLVREQAFRGSKQMLVERNHLAAGSYVYVLSNRENVVARGNLVFE